MRSLPWPSLPPDCWPSPAGRRSSAAADKETTAFFNGKDLTGWEGLKQYWSVKDGAIVGSTPKDPGFNTFLCSKKKYKDFELNFQVRLKGGVGNSGVQIRSGIFDLEQLRRHGAAVRHRASSTGAASTASTSAA